MTRVSLVCPFSKKACKECFSTVEGTVIFVTRDSVSGICLIQQFQNLVRIQCVQ